MLKKTIAALLVVAGLLACSKKNYDTAGCPQNQICTDEFVAIGVQFVNKAFNTVRIKDITVTNLRTNAAIVAKNVIDPGFSPDTYFIATDSNKSEFSTQGDDIKITATDAATGKTATAILKISGGCNCHILNLSGNNKIVFDE
jgi:hypothetical protein